MGKQETLAIKYRTSWERIEHILEEDPPKARGRKRSAPRLPTASSSGCAPGARNRLPKELGETAPCQRPFHNPPARRIPLVARGVQLLLADASGCAPYGAVVRRQPHGLTGLSYPLSRHRCWGGLGGLWSFDHNGVQGRLQQLGIVHVCSRNHNAQGAALSIHKETALGTSLQPATVRRVGPNQVPPKRALPMERAVCLSIVAIPGVHAIQLLHPSTRASPHSVRRRTVPTHRKGAMNGAVVKALSAIGSRPLAPAAQPEDGR